MRGKETAYRLVVVVICAAAISPSLHGQEEREYIRKGNRLYRKSEFAGSEGMYRLAEEEENLQAMRSSTSVTPFTGRTGLAKLRRNSAVQYRPVKQIHSGRLTDSITWAIHC